MKLYIQPLYKRVTNIFIYTLLILKVFCHRPHSEQCCGGHLENGQHSLTNHQFGVANLINNVRPLMITSTELDKSPEISKIATGTNNACQNVINQQGNQHFNTKTILSLN